MDSINDHRFNDAVNHEALKRLGAAAVLVRLLVFTVGRMGSFIVGSAGAETFGPGRTDDEGSESEKRSALETAMWASAALQNLAADYCHSDDGRCPWNWDEAAGAWENSHM